MATSATLWRMLVPLPPKCSIKVRHLWIESPSGLILTDVHLLKALFRRQPAMGSVEIVCGLVMLLAKDMCVKSGARRSKKIWVIDK
jgi:hypothetical protein